LYIIIYHFINFAKYLEHFGKTLTFLAKNMFEIFKQIYIVIALIGIANGLLLSVILFFKKKGNKFLNKNLAILFLSLSFVLLPHLLMTKYKITATYEHIPFVYCIYLMALATVGPSLYIYMKAHIKKIFKFKTIELLHYLFVLFIFIGYLIFIKNHDPFWDALHYGSLIQLSLYLILTTLLYIQLIKQHYHKTLIYSKFEVVWLSVFYFSLTIIWFIHFNHQVEIFTSYIFNYYIFKLQSELLTVLLYFVLISELFYNSIDKLNTNLKYSKSKLDEADIKRYLENIHNYMLKENRFKDSSLSLPILAKDLNLSSNIISQLINEQLSQNFCDYLNSYRIEEAKKMLIDKTKQNLTIASIAYDCGFNSLSAFNNAFKKFTKMNPSQYKRKNYFKPD
jgi:AraC-like DNA-binding protein